MQTEFFSRPAKRVMWAPDEPMTGGDLPGNLENTPGAGPQYAQIAELAQRYWEDEGRPEGRAEEHWARAERELRDRGGAASS